MQTAMGISFFLVAVWWIALTVPLREIIPSDTQSETDSTRRTVRCAKIGTDRF